MNINLLKYLYSRVRISKYPSHQEYQVAGINWNTEELYLIGDTNFWCNYLLVDIIPDIDEDYEVRNT